ncbi:MAG: hypothetical protein V7735_05345 [Photobacterium frigidiphilum]|uniref:hypothetical protein n=1 Tax=Photobacterium frigidiphilum TaxID=264736 RepID=UPI003001447B
MNEFENNYSFSSLRSVDYQADKDFYGQLSDQALLTMDRISSSHRKELTLALVKANMGINYRVLTQVVGDLTKKNYLKVKIREGVSRETYQSSDVLLYLTSTGQDQAKSLLYSMQGITE